MQWTIQEDRPTTEHEGRSLLVDFIYEFKTEESNWSQFQNPNEENV